MGEGAEGQEKNLEEIAWYSGVTRSDILSRELKVVGEVFGRSRGRLCEGAVAVGNVG